MIQKSLIRLKKDFSPILNLKTAYSSRKFHYLDETASLVAPHSPSFMPNYSGTMIPPLPALQFSSTNAQYEFLRISSPISIVNTYILFLLRHLHFHEFSVLFNELLEIVVLKTKTCFKSIHFNVP